jgi:hypothetical protein
MKKLILLGLLLCTQVSHASSLDALAAIGIGKNVIGSEPFERFGTVGLRYGDVFKVQANGGYYLAIGANEKSSWFTSVQTGIEVVGSGGAKAIFMFGPAYLGNPDDNKLSGHLQFHLTGGIGIKDTKNYGLSLLWNHFSNAGIKQPNLGRDMITLQITIPIIVGI